MCTAVCARFNEVVFSPATFSHSSSLAGFPRRIKQVTLLLSLQSGACILARVAASNCSFGTPHRRSELVCSRYKLLASGCPLKYQ